MQHLFQRQLETDAFACTCNKLKEKVAKSTQNLTLSVATSMGPLFWPTRKNSTVTVFFSVRLEALERWVNRGKALARAQAEAKTSERSHTICNSTTAKQSHNTTGDALKSSCYLGFYWGRGGKRRWWDITEP